MTKPIFPPASKDYVLGFQFSSWYPSFVKYTIKSTIVRPLPDDFCEYLDADGIFIPEGSENIPPESLLSDGEKTEIIEDNGDPPINPYSFPDLDKKIRECIEEYDAVFPKLNFSSPKDASWLLPSSSPLKCTSPADVYLLLKASDFVNHDLLVENVFEGCDPNEDFASHEPEYKMELVLRKWYPVDRGRELRCFVRENILLGCSQRDTNYYEFWNEEQTKMKVTSTVEEFWAQNIRDKWSGQPDCYTFDFLLTRDFARGHILDFNPYMRKTDPFLFTYEELRDILKSLGPNHRPILRVIDSRSHPAATRNAPAQQHNMLPFDVIRMSSGQDMEAFTRAWQESIRQSTEKESDEESGHKGST